MQPGKKSKDDRKQDDVADFFEKIKRELRRKRRTRVRPEVIYRPALISYIDILGFKKAIETRSADNIFRLLRKFRTAFKPDEHEAKVVALRTLTFSDLIVRVTFVPDATPEPGPDGLVFWELLGLLLNQIELVSEGILVRGAVTLGHVYCSAGMIFGPGLVSAYTMEQVAVHPRIVVSEEVLQSVAKPPFRNREHSVKEELQYIGDFVSTDSDGKHYVDYLKGAPQNMDDPGDFISFLLRHKELVEAGLAQYASDAHTLEKFQWLKAKHDASVAGLRSGVLSAYGCKKSDLSIK